MQVGSRRLQWRLKNRDHRDRRLRFCSSDLSTADAMEICERKDGIAKSFPCRQSEWVWEKDGRAWISIQQKSHQVDSLISYYLARRSLEHLRSTRGQYCGRGSDSLSSSFRWTRMKIILKWKPRICEQRVRWGTERCTTWSTRSENQQHERKTLSTRIEGRGQFEQADMIDYERRRFQNMLDEANSRNPVP